MPKRGSNKYKKTSISFRDDIMKHARHKAHEEHGSNLSGYLSYLVSLDMQGVHIQTVEIKKDVKSLEVEPVSNKAKNAIDDIMSFASEVRK